jgi:hypothetical protein
VVNRTLAATLTVTLCTAGAWGAGAWHGGRAASASQPQLPAAVSTPADPDRAIVPDAVIIPPDDRASAGAASGWSSLPIPLLDDATPGGDLDLYGNEVSNAVATYKSDRTGSVYEEHSPHTEVPRLPAPTT